MEIEQKGAFCFDKNCKGILFKTEKETMKCAENHDFYLFYCKDVIKVSQVQDENKLRWAKNL